MDVKSHTLEVMRHLRDNIYGFYRLNASETKEIKKLETILELLNKWIFVEEVFSQRKPKEKGSKQRDEND